MRNHSPNIASKTSLPRWDFSSMVCCDPDELQFRKQINESTWEFVQVTHPKLYDLFNGLPEQFCKAYDGDSVLNGIYVRNAVHAKGGIVCSIINLNEYKEEEVEDYIYGYGYTLKDVSCGRTPIKKLYENWQQICCECIFEQDNQSAILANMNGLVERN